MGFEQWEVGFGTNMGWEMGLEPLFWTLFLSARFKVVQFEMPQLFDAI